jgi:hypothetical protein
LPVGGNSGGGESQSFYGGQTGGNSPGFGASGSPGFGQPVNAGINQGAFGGQMINPNQGGIFGGNTPPPGADLLSAYGSQPNPTGFYDSTARPQNNVQANDTTMQGYQTQMQSIKDRIAGTDQHKNIAALGDTMNNYYAQNQGNVAGDETYANYQKQMQDMQTQFQGSDDYKNMQGLENQMKQQQQQTAQSQNAPAGGLNGNPQFVQNYLNNMLRQKPVQGEYKRPSYDEYVANRSPYQQDLQLSREAYENPISSFVNPVARMAQGGMAYAQGGISSLGGYSDGGRMLKGPGDGMSDSIPAKIGSKQPARLADGEFVVPADVVSHLGNGSTDAGARQLYGMMDRIRAQRTGKKRQAPQVNPKKAMPR